MVDPNELKEREAEGKGRVVELRWRDGLTLLCRNRRETCCIDYFKDISVGVDEKRMR